MNYILILLIILFLNKQNKDEKGGYRYRGDFENRVNKNNIKNNYFEGNAISRLEKNKIKKNEPKTNKDKRNIKNIEVQKNINEYSNKRYKSLEEDRYLIKNDNKYNEGPVNNNENNIIKSQEKEINKEKENNKEKESNKQEGYSSIDKSKINEKKYSDLNDNKQYKIIDICKDNDKFKEQESYKESVISIINNKLSNDIDKETTYNRTKENDSNKRTVIYDDIELEETPINDFEEKFIKDITLSDKKDNIEENIEEKNNIQKESFQSNKSKFNQFKKIYRGVNVSILISGVGVIEGEIVFDFPNIIAVKNKENIIIFIDESKILGIY